MAFWTHPISGTNRTSRSPSRPINRPCPANHSKRRRRPDRDGVFLSHGSNSHPPLVAGGGRSSLQVDLPDALTQTPPCTAAAGGSERPSISPNPEPNKSPRARSALVSLIPGSWTMSFRARRGIHAVSPINLPPGRRARWPCVHRPTSTQCARFASPDPRPTIPLPDSRGASNRPSA